MNPDLTLLSDKDLEALSLGKIDLMSDAGLAILAGEQPKVVAPKKMTAKEEVQAAFGFDKPKPQAQSAGDLLRNLGLTARGALTGAASLPAMFADVPASIVNLAAGRQVYKPQAEAFGDFLSALGAPKAETPAERLMTESAAAIGGVVAPVGVAQKIISSAIPTGLLPAAEKGVSQAVSSGAVRDFLATGKPITGYKFVSNAPASIAYPTMIAENVPAQIAAATGGALAGGAARESDANPLMQLIGSIAGSVAPGAATSLGPAAARAAKEVVRPGTQAGREAIAGGVLRQLSREPETAIKAMEGYQAPVSGYTPTAAQASRDVGLIAAETPIRALDVTGKFGAQASQANQARMAILDRLAKDKQAVEFAVTKRDDVSDPLREAAFAKSTVSPETFQSAVNLTVNQTIDDILGSSAGARSTVENTMNWAKEQIKRGTTPERLYEVRKDLRDASQGRLDKDGAAYSLAKGQLEQVIRSIDDAIDAAAPGYKDYLKKYAQSSKGIEKLEAAQEFRGKVLSTTPDPSRIGDYMISQPSFTRAIRNAEKETNLSNTQLAVLKKVAQDLDSGVLNRAVKTPGSDTFKNLSTANIIGAFIGKQMFGEVPAAVNKVAAPLNWLYNGTDDQIRELLVDAMLDPKLASKLMTKASVVSVEPLSKELQRKAIAAGYGASFGLTEK